MPVKLPEINVKRELARKLAESAISQIPYIGGPYVAMLSITHRSDAERKLEKWREEVTSSVNNIEQAIADLLPTIKLSSNASDLGYWLSKTSVNGRADSASFEAIQAEFRAATKLELEDACGELELEALATTAGALGQKIIYVRPTNLLFEVFDPIAFEDANPRVDAAHLARFILKDDGGVGTEIMLDHFGWTTRRLNPAISIVCGMVDESHRSAEWHAKFVCPYIMPDSAERARLKRYAKTILGEGG
jgi:hypothetical protein